MNVICNRLGHKHKIEDCTMKTISRVEPLFWSRGSHYLSSNINRTMQWSFVPIRYAFRMAARVCQVFLTFEDKENDH